MEHKYTTVAASLSARKACPSPSERKKHSLPGLIVEPHGFPASVARRTAPEVDDNVEDRTAHASHVLGLPWRHVGRMDTAHDTPSGYRAVGLVGIKVIAEIVGEFAATKPFQEALLCHPRESQE